MNLGLNFTILLLQISIPDRNLSEASSYQNALGKLDDILNADLAATLAGLSLAALALLLTIAYPIKDRILKLRKDNNEAESEKHIAGINSEIELNQKRLKDVKNVISNIYTSFILFILFLLETLTLDVEAEKNISYFKIPYSLPADLLLSGGFILSGVIFMWIGAKKMKSILEV